MLVGVKLDNILLTCEQGNFTQITARGCNQTLASVVRDPCTVPPVTHCNEEIFDSIPIGLTGGVHELICP